MKSLTIIILGGTGDLSKKKLLPAVNKLVERHVCDKINVIVTGRRDFSEKEYLEFIGVRLHEDIRLHYFRTDFTKQDSLKGLDGLLKNIEDNDCIGRIFYLATSPEFFKTISKQISKIHNVGFKRMMIEKPFGHDLESSKALDRSLQRYFDEDQIFRVDHYLGKETVQNILILRLANPFFARTWNSEFIDQIKITVSENFGVAERIDYYDNTGAIRDMIQNHLLQMAAFILIDNPVDSDPKNIAKEKANAIKKLEVKDISIGQYEGYDDELKSHDRKTSKTETFVKLSIFSRAKRWKNTKIILVTGKHLARKYADIELSYKKEPCILYFDINTYPNRLILNIQPVQDIDFHINTKTPGTNFEIKHTKLIFSHEKEFSSNTPESYEVIIEECINNDKTLFISNEELSAAWRFTDKIRDIASKMDPIIYKKGSDESDIKE